MRLDVFPNLVPSLIALLTLMTGCAPGWACGESASGRGCFCTSEEVLTTATAVCSASVTGASHCCDNPAEDICTCSVRPRCWTTDSGVCQCGRTPPAGSVPVTECTAEAGFLCCISPVFTACTCGLAECLLEDDIPGVRCDADDVEVFHCQDDEVPVSDCLTRE